MKQAGKFELWIDHSIAQLMKITGDIDLANSGESASESNEVPMYQTLAPHAEASDFLSINEWLDTRDDRTQ